MRREELHSMHAGLEARQLVLLQQEDALAKRAVGLNTREQQLAADRAMIQVRHPLGGMYYRDIHST